MSRAAGCVGLSGGLLVRIPAAVYKTLFAVSDRQRLFTSVHCRLVPHMSEVSLRPLWELAELWNPVNPQNSFNLW